MAERPQPISDSSFLENHPHLTALFLPTALGALYFATRLTNTWVRIPREVSVHSVRTKESGHHHRRVTYNGWANEVFVPDGAFGVIQVNDVEIEIHDFKAWVAKGKKGGARIFSEGRVVKIDDDQEADIQIAGTTLHVVHERFKPENYK